MKIIVIYDEDDIREMKEKDIDDMIDKALNKRRKNDKRDII